MRYLDILRNLEQQKSCERGRDEQRSGTSPSNARPAPDEINEKNEKRGAVLRPGMWVEWDSPLFGPCSGEVAMEPEGGWLVVREHSVTGDLALINTAWLRRG